MEAVDALPRSSIIVRFGELADVLWMADMGRGAVASKRLQGGLPRVERNT